MKEKGVELEKLKTEFDNYKARNIVVVLEYRHMSFIIISATGAQRYFISLYFFLPIFIIFFLSCEVDIKLSLLFNSNGRISGKYIKKMDTDPYLCLVHSVSPHAYQRLYPLLLQVRAQSVLKQAKDANQQEFIIMICNINVRVVLDIQIRD